jgi:hypothetical protein
MYAHFKTTVEHLRTVLKISQDLAGAKKFRVVGAFHTTELVATTIILSLFATVSIFVVTNEVRRVC